MAHYARINVLTKKVDKVLCISEDVINTFQDYDLWIQTSYNTHAGKHRLGGTQLRKNFANVGFTYDIEKDAFIPPKQHASWILNEETCLWNAPVAYPEDDKMYRWNEETVNWIEVQTS